MKTKNSKSAFTLIEVLVIISIIVILSTIIYASFNGAKAKSRDQKRVSDISLIQLSLELFFNKKGFYPQKLDDLPDIASIPKPPPTPTGINYDYNYFPLANSLNPTICISYQIWTTFEADNSYLKLKKNFNSADLSKTSYVECGSGHTSINASSMPLVYDVISQ